MRSCMGLANTAMAGEILVMGSGVFLYVSIARWNASQSSSPLSGVLPASARLTVFTPISARELLCGLATEQRRWCTPQLVRKVLVTVAVNSGPPSVVMSSGIPNVTKVERRTDTSPVAPWVDRSTMGHPEKRSTITT